MTGKVKPIPEGYHTATPYMSIRGAAKAIEFYKKAFNATEIMRMGEGDKIHHAEIKIGDSMIMLADEFPEMNSVGPQTLGNTSVAIMLYVDNVDTIFNQAVEAGATVQRPLADQFYGDRSGGVVDPFGHKWWISQHVEDVPEEEMKVRADKAQKEMKEKMAAGAKS